jgi:hypothetical protein
MNKRGCNSETVKLYVKIKPQYFFFTLPILHITLPFLTVHTWALHYRGPIHAQDQEIMPIPPTLFMGEGGGREGPERRVRVAIDLSTGSFISLGYRWRRNSSGGGVKGGWRWTPPSASWAENTIMTECTQGSGHLQSMFSLVCGEGVPLICKPLHTMDERS